jgi:hypothetical protein
VITIQREQYDATVHLFIGTRRSPDKITFIFLIFIVNHKASYQGLSSLFPFRSVPFSSFVIILSRSSSHCFGVRSSCFRVVSLYQAYLHLKDEASCISLCYAGKHISYVFEDLWKRKVPTLLIKIYPPRLSFSISVYILGIRSKNIAYSIVKNIAY